MTDKVRGSLFNMLEAGGFGFSRVLDLYSGTGAVGIEALSRGADWADFVEGNAKVCQIIRDNLAHTRFTDSARVHQRTVQQFISSAGSRQSIHFPEAGTTNYDIIIMDPPYADPAIEATIETLGVSTLLHEETILVVGHSPRVVLADQYNHLERFRHRRLGDCALSLYRPPGNRREAAVPEGDIYTEGA